MESSGLSKSRALRQTLQVPGAIRESLQVVLEIFELWEPTE